MADNSTTVSDQRVDFSIFSLPVGSRGSIQVDLNISLIVISTTLLFIRLYVRGFMVKALGLDDLLATVAYVCSSYRPFLSALADICTQVPLICLSVIEILAVGVGSGTHKNQIPTERMPTFFSVSRPYVEDDINNHTNR
jgi:hypothetical protein